jgi:hypothetical protein
MEKDVLMKGCGGPAYAGRQAERCICMYVCRRRGLTYTYKYARLNDAVGQGTAKETEQKFKIGIRPQPQNIFTRKIPIQY